MIYSKLKIKGTKHEFDIIANMSESNVIVINLPGYGGSIDGFNKKYEKLADYMCNTAKWAVVRMPNVMVPKTEYGFILVSALETVIEYAISNAEFICGNKNPDIYLIGTSAGGGAVALVAHRYPEIKKILLVCPAGGNVSRVNDSFSELEKFTGDVNILIGREDEVVGVHSGDVFSHSAVRGNAKNVSYEIIPNCDHNFTGEENGRILSRAPFWAFNNDINFPNYKESCKLYDTIIPICENCTFKYLACSVVKTGCVHFKAIDR